MILYDDIIRTKINYKIFDNGRKPVKGEVNTLTVNILSDTY